jgi:phosphatidylserine/phosphatidylglycerophosphate/cardiolipin synthase-like enzyme
MMIKKIIIGLVFILTGSIAITAQDNIAAARGMNVGQTVTVTGVVTNGDELGPIRYMQDETAGIAVYSDLVANVNRGDEITVTGVLKDYNTLLEIDPATSVTVNSTGNPSPAPVVLTPDQFAEEYEGMLVRVNNAKINSSGVFERTSYTFASDGETGQMYVNSFDSPLIGAVIPTNEVSVIGPLGAYNDTYQLLPRDQFDFLSSSIINLTSVPVMSDLSTSGFSVHWTTDVAGTTEAFVGNTPDLEMDALAVSGERMSHSLDITGLDPSELVYIQPFSVKEQDTIKAAVQVYITQSISSGDVKAYFNRPVDNSVSLGFLDARYLDHAIDDTLIQYINRAEESIEFTIYNFNNNGISNLSDALNAAHNRGVVVRVIYDSNIDAVGVESLDAGIGRIASPQSEYPLYGIMHNKFIVFDANSSDPDKPIVWTGATNFTNGQINTDPNNVIIVQDKSLAKTFQLEFNEMFGGDGPQPDPLKAKFGPDKTDNTPHEFIINGNRVECYFSPSDGTHTKILDVIETADHTIHIATMLITKADIGYSLSDKNDDGVDVKVLINDFDQYGEPIVNTLKESLEDDIRIKGENGIMHHKYMIVDQGFEDSDPILLTGSHNWSSSAQFRNDENTLIFHDQAVANAYYQEFVVRFGNGQIIVPKPECSNDFVTMHGGSSFRYDVLYNDDLPGPVNVSVSRQPSNGTATVESDNTITYIPNPGFNQDIDTVSYTVCLASSSGICDSALFVIYVNKPVGVDDRSLDQRISVYPIPAKDIVHISSENDFPVQSIRVFDHSGREVLRSEHLLRNNIELPVHQLNDGVYYLRIELHEGIITRKIIVQ